MHAEAHSTGHVHGLVPGHGHGNLTHRGGYPVKYPVKYASRHPIKYSARRAPLARTQSTQNSALSLDGVCNKSDVILCIGDSLTAGKKGSRSYPTQLQRLLDEGRHAIHVHSSGVWGEKSQELLKRVPAAVQAALAEGGRLAFVLILVGTNDILQSHPGQAEMLIPSILQNIERICETAANAAYLPHVGILTLPPLATRQSARLRLNEEIRRMVARSSTRRSIGRRFLVDLETVDPAMASDGVHFNEEGYMEFARRVRGAILPLLQAQSSRSVSHLKPWQVFCT